MGDDFIQLRATENDCVYLFDLATGKCQKVCDIDFWEIPESVRRRVEAMDHEFEAAICRFEPMERDYESTKCTFSMTIEPMVTERFLESIKYSLPMEINRPK